MNLTIFDELYENYKINKPIRLIELFAGYGSQMFALKYLGANAKHYKICEWAIKSIQAYNDAHIQDYTDYSKNYSDDEILDKLVEYGVSSNYNEPATREQIKRQNFRKIYNNIIATNNLVNIQNAKGKDFEIVDKDIYIYICSYSFPCQDLSLAGKGKGMADTTTRSGMLWEVERILGELKELNQLPQILLMENVPQVHGSDNVEHFNKWQLKLEELGYKNYWQDLIATDYGIPQTRNRCFMISILGDYNYTFPKKQKLELKLKDLLEKNVDEKYYLSDKLIKGFMVENAGGYPRKERFEASLKNTTEKNIAATITTKAGTRATDNFIIDDDNLKKELCNKLIQEKKVEENDVIRHSYSNSRLKEWEKRNVEHNNLSPTLDTRCDCLGVCVKETENYIQWQEKGKLESDCRAAKEDKVSLTITTTPKTKVLIKNATKQGYLEASEGDGVDISSRMQHHRGTVQKEKSQTLTTSCDIGTLTSDLRIRKLTPKECFRLMGVKDEDYENIAKNQSNSSLYHLAGDSIVVNVLMEIFKGLL